MAMKKYGTELTFEIPVHPEIPVTAEQLNAGAAAAWAVFEEAGVHPYDAGHADVDRMLSLEQMDDLGSMDVWNSWTDEDYGLQEVWEQAIDAAQKAANVCFYDKLIGDIAFPAYDLWTHERIGALVTGIAPRFPPPSPPFPRWKRFFVDGTTDSSRHYH